MHGIDVLRYGCIAVGDCACASPRAVCSAVAPTITPTHGTSPVLVDVFALPYGTDPLKARLSVTFDGESTPDCTLPVALQLSKDNPVVILDQTSQSSHMVSVMIGVAAAFRITETTTFKAKICLEGVPSSPQTSVTVTIDKQRTSPPTLDVHSPTPTKADARLHCCCCSHRTGRVDSKWPGDDVTAEFQHVHCGKVVHLPSNHCQRYLSHHGPNCNHFHRGRPIVEHVTACVFAQLCSCPQDGPHMDGSADSLDVAFTVAVSGATTAEAQAEKDKVEAELAAAILSGTIVWCPTGWMKDCAHVQLRHRHSSRFASGQRRRG